MPKPYIPGLLSYVQFMHIILIAFYSPKFVCLGDSEETFWSSSQTATSPSVYHTRRRLHVYTVPLTAERPAGKP